MPDNTNETTAPTTMLDKGVPKKMPAKERPESGDVVSYTASKDAKPLQAIVVAVPEGKEKTPALTLKVLPARPNNPKKPRDPIFVVEKVAHSSAKPKDDEPRWDV